MNRLSTALCFSTATVALVVAGFALVQSRSTSTDAPGGDHEQDLQELQTLVASLQEQVDELAQERDTLLRQSRGPRVARTKAGVKNAELAAAESGELEEQVAVLSARLASLEDEETIARLAQSGNRQVLEKDLRSAFDRVRDPEADPEERLGALERLRAAGKRHRDIVGALMEENELSERDIYLPMFGLAQDTTLDPEFRAEVLRNFHGTRIDEMRQPLLDMLATEESPEVRVEALTSLFWHIEDPTVRETIRETGERDPNEQVQARVQRILPKVEHLDREAAEAESERSNRDAK